MYLNFFFINGWCNRYSKLFGKKNNTVKEKLDENQIDILKDIRNLVSNEFQNYYSPLDATLYYIDQLFEANERTNSFYKRREINTHLKFNIIFLVIWKSLMDEDIL